jgi:hypothetical protein
MIAPPDGLIGRPNLRGNAHRRQGSRSKTLAAGSASIDTDHLVGDLVWLEGV